MTDEIRLTFTAEAMIPVPISRWRRLWLRARRKPFPVRAPEGTVQLTFDTLRPDGTRVRTIIPAARIGPTRENHNI